MQGRSVFGVPLLPLLGNLSNRSIRAAGHVTNDAIVPYPHVIALLVVQVLQVWEELSVMVRYHDVSRV